ncbi:MAG TPA: acyl-CoA dehydrogenase family protein, partial [Candidatus Acidoferrum sp.]|nr:acyl-CoA dehydrogenase family protein [Candidatus Acidoferrum sp.]
FTDSCAPALVREMKAAGSDGVPAELWGVLAKTGIFGLGVPEEYGGEGASLYELGLVFQEAGRVLCPTIVYSTLLFGIALGGLGTAAQKTELLGLLASGDLKATMALWNPDDARDTQPYLTAERVDGGWNLTGTLLFVPNGSRADVLMVTARAGASETSPTYGFLIKPGADGWAAAEHTTIAGDKQSALVLEQYFVPEGSVISGDDGVGIEDQLRWVGSAAVALGCMEMVGGATAVLERTVEYVKAREQFGRPLASFQAVQHQVADVRIAIDGARLAATQAVWRVGRGEVADRAVAVAKMHCGETYKLATFTAHQLHGGMGYVRETDLHLWSERAKVAELQGGSADVAAHWLESDLGLAG